MENKCAIYKISFNGCKRPYIGSTLNYHRRKSQHLYKLRRNNHDNIKLQKAFNKYGEKNFKFEVIKYFINKSYDFIRKEEQKILNKYFAQQYIKSKFKDKRFDKLLLNISPEVDLMRVHWTKERRKALINRNKNFVWTKKMRDHMSFIKTGIIETSEHKNKIKKSIKAYKDKIKIKEGRSCVYCNSFDIVKLGIRFNKTKKLYSQKCKCNICKKYQMIIITTGQLTSNS